MTRHTITRGPMSAIGADVVGRYRDRIFDDRVNDPYQSSRKYREPTVCGGCGAVYEHGRWRWGIAPEEAHRTTCPACRRIADKQPAGYLTVEGDFFEQHKDELLRLARHVEQRERDEHPMSRIIAVDTSLTPTTITTTDIHLPQRIGNALENAYGGTCGITYGEDEYIVRALWRR